MEYTYHFNLKYESYLKPELGPSIVDACNRVAHLIIGPYSIPFWDACREVAISAAHFQPDYLDQYFESSCKTLNYTYDAMKVIKYSKYLYFLDVITNNSKEIVQNAVIAYVNNITFSSDIEYDPDEIKSFITCYIRDLEAHVCDRINTYVKNFKSALLSKFKVRIHTAHLKNTFDVLFNTEETDDEN